MPDVTLTPRILNVSLGRAHGVFFVGDGGGGGVGDGDVLCFFLVLRCVHDRSSSWCFKILQAVSPASFAKTPSSILIAQAHVRHSLGISTVRP